MAILALAGGVSLVTAFGQTPPGYASASVKLTPVSTTVAPGGTLAFTATVSGAASNPYVSWSVDGVWKGNTTVGTIPGVYNTTTYYAPATPGTHVVKATSNFNNTKSASATVTVASPAAPSGYNAVSVTLTPSSSTVAPGGTVSFTGTVSGASSNPSVSWSVDGVWQGNSTVGTIPGLNNTTSYNAPLTPGTHVVKATSNYNNTKSASATVTVQAAAAVAVSVTPGSVSVNTGSSATLTAAVSGSSNTAVAWTVDGVANGNASVGAVTGTGNSVTYTAPTAAGSHTVKATCAADATKSASAVVSVLAAAVTVTSNPASATLSPSGSVAITATVGGSSNTAVIWSVDGVANGNATAGTLTVSGNTATYKAPASAGSHTVTASSAANPASSSTTAITVQASSGTAAVTLTHPGSGTVNVSGSMLFTATVTGSSNTAVTWAVDGVANGNATVGTVTKGTGNNVALYKAPASAGSHTVTAISAADATRNASAAVTVASTAYTIINPSNIYNVKTSYGATGNGSTDDTAAIQNAINAASSAGGGLVEVPSGTYMINLKYQMGEVGLLMKSNVTLQLDAGATLKAMAGAPGTSYMVMFSGGSNMNLVGAGTLDGNKASIGLHEGIENIGFWGATNVVLAGFTSQNAPGDGIYINGYPAGAGVGAPVTHVLIYNVTCTANGRNGMSPDGCDDLIVRDCTFSNQASANPGNGIDIEPINAQAPNNYQIFNCQFTGNAGGGIQSGPCDSGDNATFTNMTYAFNTVSNCGDYGIDAQNGAGPFYILNNTVSGTYLGTGVFTCYPGYGIMVRGSNGIRNVTISGNSVTTSHGDGIMLSSASASTCAYNTVTSSTGKGINNLSGAGVTLSNNTLTGNAGGN